MTQYLAPIGPNPTVSEEGIQFIIGFESFKPNVYKDPAGLLTIGFGHRLLQGETFPNTLTREQGLDLLRADIQTRVQPGLNLVTVALTQNQVDALGSFIFNIGPTKFEKTDLLPELNKGDYNAVTRELPLFIYAGGKVQSGLVERRAKEVELFNTR